MDLDSPQKWTWSVDWGDPRSVPSITNHYPHSRSAVFHPNQVQPFLSHQTVCLNLFEVNRKSSSVVSLNSCHAQVFSSADTEAVILLVTLYLSVSLGVLHENHVLMVSFFSLYGSHVPDPPGGVEKISLHVWFYWVCPAASPSTGDQYTSLPLASPECPRHRVTGQITQL